MGEWLCQVRGHTQDMLDSALSLSGGGGGFLACGALIASCRHPLQNLWKCDLHLHSCSADSYMALRVQEGQHWSPHDKGQSYPHSTDATPQRRKRAGVQPTEHGLRFRCCKAVGWQSCGGNGLEQGESKAMK